MKKLITIFSLVLLVASCKKDIESLNQETKRPLEVTPSSLFANAQKKLVDQLTSSSVNQNIFRLIAQHWTETTYTDESNYDLGTRNIPQNFWDTLYTRSVKNFAEAARLIPSQDPTYVSASTIKNEAAITEIMSVYTWYVLVSVYGNIPYSKALDINNVSPAYDDAATIYTDLLARLDAALGKLDVSGESFGVSDLLFEGDVSHWVVFGNSLKLKMGMQLADANAAKAKTTVEAATLKAIGSNDDNATFAYQGAPPNTNPIWVDLVQSGRKDFVAANTLVDVMNGLNDPRRKFYFTGDSTSAFINYNGGEYGSSNNYATYSKPGTKLLKQDFEALLLDYSEMEFIRAEAIERGMSVGGTAAQHYNNAIAASIEYWGGTAADITAYLAQPSVAYATAAGTYKQKIGIQKWIALYNRGFDAWTEWRRLDFPKLVAPVDALSDIPLRYPYPVQEQNLNTKNYDAAAAAIGGDLVTTKLFWDKF
jgi:hypothetical protein